MRNLPFALLTAILLFAGCGGDSDSADGMAYTPPTQAQLTQNAFADELSTGSGFSFTANTAWTASVSETVTSKSTANPVSWLKLYNGNTEVYSGAAGSFTLAIVLIQNYTGETRVAEIVIAVGDNWFKITITQAGTKEDGSPNAPVVAVTSVSLNKTTLSLDAGDNETLTATVAPTDATWKTVSWSSSAPTVATVDDMGKVTAVAEGTAIITASAGDKKADCTVTVVEPFDVYSAITDAEFLVRAKAADWDTNGNGRLSEAEASAITSIDVSNSSDYEGTKIASLAGIEYFTGLTTLNCNYNALTALDPSTNKALTSLICNKNQIAELDISANTALTSLECWANQLTKLDISANTALTKLSCSSNQLTELNVKANTALESLNCGENQLTELDVTSNTALESLSCYGNQLTELDLSPNTALISLQCAGNRYTKLDLSANTALTTLACYNSQLAELDISSNTELTSLTCNGSQLTELDISNNTKLTLFVCYNNPTLATIWVWSAFNTTDPKSNFSWNYWGDKPGPVFRVKE